MTATSQVAAVLTLKAPSRSGAVSAPAQRRWSQLNVPLTNWTGRRVWLVGASSGIGLACAQALRAAGAVVMISARQPQGVIDWAAQDSGVQWHPLDVTVPADVQATAGRILADGPIDLLVYAAGYYRAQRATALDVQDLLQHDRVNYQGALHVLDAVLPDMLARQSGHISLLSSVAAWRGLPNGLAYGPTKAALTHLAETLYMDLQDQNIGVSVISPGFVATPLTAQNQFAMPALLSPEQAAAEMLKGWASGQFDIHFPKRFTWWLKCLRLLPYRLYFPLVRKFTGL
ncbi:short-chain dehydrogenase [Limnohabitans sp. T6-5]|uniref:SDR family NAD(P)-dependent oxidoreductase n=1 Tax=Limnohabitans sp. T6-5 TaxID=1100724 RepID=UPI000D36C484|nr:SDR family NAD(P)-dependent oxidoreductase [Limnohabitans sp. T6-5]PUE05886.1 short-chain dehydrogenase [Limnohabitans sp. T6-5]